MQVGKLYKVTRNSHTYQQVGDIVICVFVHKVSEHFNDLFMGLNLKTKKIHNYWIYNVEEV